MFNNNTYIVIYTLYTLLLRKLCHSGGLGQLMGVVLHEPGKRLETLVKDNYNGLLGYQNQENT